MEGIADGAADRGRAEVIRTRDLTKEFGRGVRAVDRLNLTVRAGEVYGFLGPNGAGKTTTLRMLLGLVRPTSGSALVLGRPPGDPVGLSRVGAMVEEPAFYPYLSGRDNLRVLARYARVPQDRIDAALESVDLVDRADDRVRTYSQGMRQRLGVAAALLKDPEVLILDEPTNGLDPAGVGEMRSLIRRLGASDRTVVLSSHMLAEVQELCDRVAVVSHGVLLAEGTVEDLTGRGAILVRATPLEAARERAERLFGSDRVKVDDGALRLDAAESDAPRITRELVLSGIAVSEVRQTERTLEEAFLELTKEER
ncbi:MAG TPA: ABC transporter ATP-binding protein [Actinomycetota bacterium]